MADGEKQLSQAEIDALTGRVGGKKRTGTSQPHAPEAADGDAPPTRPRADKTLSQDEIDAILFSRADQEPGLTTNEAHSTQAPRLVQDATLRKKTPPTKQAPAAKTISQEEETPPARRVTGIKKIPPIRMIPLPEADNGIPEDIFLSEEAPAPRRAAPKRPMTAQQPTQAEDIFLAEEIMPTQEALSPTSKPSAARAKPAADEMFITEEIAPARKTQLTEKTPPTEEPLPSADSFMAQEINPARQEVKPARSPFTEEVLPSAEMFLAEDSAPSRKRSAEGQSLPQQTTSPSLRMAPADDATASTTDADALPSWLRPRGRPATKSESQVASEKRGFFDRIKEVMRRPKEEVAESPNQEAIEQILGESVEQVREEPAIQAREEPSAQTPEVPAVVFSDQSLSDIERRLDTLQSLCESLASAPRPTEGLDDLTSRLEQLETIFVDFEKRNTGQKDIEAVLERLQRLEQAADVSAILERIKKIQAAIDKMGLMKDEVKEDLKEEFNVDIGTIGEEIATLNKRLDIMATTLKDSLGIGIHRDFICRACGSKGYVALTIRCTHCGKEGWMGWWPEKQT